MASPSKEKSTVKYPKKPAVGPEKRMPDMNPPGQGDDDLNPDNQPDGHHDGPLESPVRTGHEHEGATEDQVSETMPPAGSAFNDEPKQG